MYNFAMYIYVALMRFAALFNPKARKMVEGHRQIWGLLRKKIVVNEKYVWLHAASLGEFEQGRPLMEAIRRNYPQYCIVLTFFSPSGYEVRKNYPGADIICYLPFDLRSNVHKFLTIVRPKMAVFIKYEFWLNYLTQLHKHNIPTYIVSSIFRSEQIFFRWYGGIFRKALSCFDRIFVQDISSKKLLASIGVRNTVVTGDTRFDRVLDIREQAKDLPLVGQFAGNASHVFVAGSSWPADEQFILPYFNEHPEMKLIIAPHEIHESHIQFITSRLTRHYMLYSQINGVNIADVDCLIIDCFGLLSSIYRYGDIAYIGGGFGAGIHNTLEAAVYEIPVIFGPNYGKFKEAKELIAAGGGFSVNSCDEFNSLVTGFIQDFDLLETAGRCAGEYVTSLTGATKRVIRALKL
jgi:3-deoxy-D-manno-octulosonic-acid transferase